MTITHAEVSLLKVLNFNYGNDHPFYYIKSYSQILYPNSEEDIIHYSNKICCDYYTYANLIYKPFVVALASVIFAASFLKLQSVRDDDFSFKNIKFLYFPPLNEKEFNNELLNYDIKENKSRMIGSLNSLFLSNLNSNSMDIENVNNDNTNNTNNNTISSNNNYFDCLEWYKKLHQYLELEDLQGK